MTTVLVPLDGSQLAEHALPFAVRVTLGSQGKLVLVRATMNIAAVRVGTASAMRIAADRQRVELAEARVALAKVREDLRPIWANVEAIAIPGPAAWAILDQARERLADLIVMSSHGRSGVERSLFGSVADEVLREGPVPVLLVGSACAEWPEQRTLRLLVALDGSPLAEAALDPALKLASWLGAEIVLVRVVEQTHNGEAEREAHDYLDPIARRIREAGKNVQVAVPVGVAAPAIVETAQTTAADVIALATHGRSGLARIVLGSVATGTLQRAHVPVLLVRNVRVAPAAEGAA